MARYHLTVSGDSALCKAVTRACPLGDAESHFNAQVPEQARVWAEAFLEAQYGLFQDDAIEALDAYQAGSYRSINDHLRGNTRIGPVQMYSALNARTIARMDAMFTHYEEVAPPKVYRHVRSGAGSKYLARPLLEGEVISEPGYLSTSEDPDFDGRYLDKGPDKDVNTYIEIDVPETSACVRPYSLTQRYGDESEVLFPRDSRFEVIGDRVEGGKRYLRLRMLDASDAREPQSQYSSEEVALRVPGALVEPGTYELRSVAVDEIADGLLVEDSNDEYSVEDVESIERFAQAYRNSAPLPPLIGETNFLGGIDVLDGNHRANGASRAGVKSVEIFVRLED